MVQSVRHADIGCRAAIDLRFAPPAAAVHFGRPLCVVRNNQVEKTIIVIVEPRSLYAQCISLRGSQPRLVRYVGEGPITVIVIKRVSSSVRDEKIRPAIVVVVGGRHSVAEILVGSI